MPSSDLDVDLLDETIQFMVEDTVRSDISLAVVPGPGAEAAQLILTLQEAESHPLHSLLRPALVNLLSIEDAKTALVVADIVEGYYSYVEAAEGAADDSTAQRRGGLGECELCERLMPLTEHHLIPRSLHDEYARKGRATLVFLRSRKNIAMLCRPCHSAVHRQISHEQLGQSYNTVEKLLEHEGIQKWAAYASKLKERSPMYPGLRLRNKR